MLRGTAVVRIAVLARVPLLRVRLLLLRVGICALVAFWRGIDGGDEFELVVFSGALFCWCWRWGSGMLLYAIVPYCRKLGRGSWFLVPRYWGNGWMRSGMIALFASRTSRRGGVASIVLQQCTVPDDQAFVLMYCFNVGIPILTSFSPLRLRLNAGEECTSSTSRARVTRNGSETIFRRYHDSLLTVETDG